METSLISWKSFQSFRNRFFLFLRTSRNILKHIQPGDRIVYLGNYTGYGESAIDSINEIPERIIKNCWRHGDYSYFPTEPMDGELEDDNPIDAELVEIEPNI